MSGARPDHVIVGEVLVAATPGGLERAEAVALAGDRVVAVGGRRDVQALAGPTTRLTDATGRAVVPGIHDFHLHLVGMARARRSVLLDDAATFEDLLGRVRRASDALRDDDPAPWLTGRGWHETALAQSDLERLEDAVAGLPAALTSHDGHSMWASATARQAAGIGPAAVDPPGGRLERDEHGRPNGVLRESAMEPVEAVKERLQGPALAAALREVLGELASLGVTGATDAGDTDVHGGVGRYADLGDSFSTLHEQNAVVAGRLRLTVNLPAAALATASSAGLRTGERLEETALRIGWAKIYSDGALGSRTAALFGSHTCGDTPDAGILRHAPDELAAIVARGRRAGIRLAIHAIGDRAVATALDALGSGEREVSAPRDRVEHAQLVRPADRGRFGSAGVVASLQPIHAAADRDAVEACWAGRQSDAYAWRALADAGAPLAFGSDAPIESHNPWHGLFCAVRRHAPGDGRDPWRPEAALTSSEALAAYTEGPALALGRQDEGHLRRGALADLAVLDVDLATLLAADEAAAAARSVLTLVGGREVDRA